MVSAYRGTKLSDLTKPRSLFAAFCFASLSSGCTTTSNIIENREAGLRSYHRGNDRGDVEPRDVEHRDFSVQPLDRSEIEEMEFARVRMLKLALEQAQTYSDRWNSEQRDCAGLIRFLFREAVTKDSRMWNGRSGSKLAFVQAEELVTYNFIPLKYSERLETGDILVFNRPNQRIEDSWHLMMVLKSPYTHQSKMLVIYHNGDHGDKAEVRKLWFEDLKTSPFSEWRPETDNPNFHGVYRWKNWY